jgi:hypothetical protein
VFYFSFLAFGALGNMNGIVNKKVFADMVPTASLTYAYAVNELIEQGFGNLASVAVGLLTDQVFHFNPKDVKAGTCAPIDADRLGRGMLGVYVVCASICFCVYCGMFWTYPKDRALLEQRTLESKAAIEPKGEAVDGESHAHDVEKAMRQLCDEEGVPTPGVEGRAEPAPSV